jgi:hypothetical protein
MNKTAANLKWRLEMVARLRKQGKIALCGDLLKQIAELKAQLEGHVL